jgi:hypothetical protein
MNNARVTAILLPLYHRAGGRGTTGIDAMLHRIADDSSHLLRLKAFPAEFEAAAMAAVASYGAHMDSELRVDLLALACEAGFSELAAAMLGAGMTWRDGDAYQCTVLAIRAGRPATLALLLQAGIDADLRGECGTPLLTHAIAAADAVMVDMLRSAGARADSEGSALSAAAVSGHPEMIRMCVDDGASLTTLGDALDHAAMAGHAQAVIQLLQAGAPVDPALLRATRRGDDEMADLICTARAGQLLTPGSALQTVFVFPGA